tara:strand:+ start:14 stop:328 length:315 start_codon:yes stop_codon:yes gene_type:complete
MKLANKIKKLCTPAYLYLVISVISLVIVGLQNLGNSGQYSIGNYSCSADNLVTIFLGKLVYIALWTFVLNWICRKGHSAISWVLVLLPFLLFFVLIGFAMLVHF